MVRMKPLVVASFLLFSIISGFGARTWTNLEGRTMEADLVAAEGDSVTFSRNGRTYDYPLANLSEEDRKYIQYWIEEQAKPSVFVSEFSEQLVWLEGQSFRDFPEEKLKEKRIVGFYYSAGWC